jgi:16S rRNA processing protein RimM
MPAEAWITIGRVVRTQGRKGEIKVALETDFPERFASLEQVYLSRSGEPPRGFRLRRAWPHQQHMVLELAGIEDITAARIWVGGEVQIPAAERWPAPRGHYFISDLAGCQVWNHGQRLGVIEGVETGAGAPLLQIRTGAGELVLAPFARDYLEAVDLGGRAIRLRLPEGLPGL